MDARTPRSEEDTRLRPTHMRMKIACPSREYGSIDRTRFTTDKGMFEIIYGGATGAMQGFGNRLTQDQILQVMAYVRSLKK
jgi:hypothetical protein